MYSSMSVKQDGLMRAGLSASDKGGSIVLLCLAGVCALVLSGCGRATYTELPQLPAKYWQAESKETNRRQAPTPQIYAPDKILTYEDLVYLAILQSPQIARGNINLDIQEIAVSDAKWKYLPEVHLVYMISNNITKYNDTQELRKKRVVDTDYGETKYYTTFTGIFNNPIVTYFSVKAQKELMNVAIATQRKAIGECAKAIAELLLQLEARERAAAALKEMLPAAEKRREAAAVKERHLADPANPASLSEDSFRDLALRLRETEMEAGLIRSQLKILVGLDISQKLSVDASSVHTALESFRPEVLSWQDRWEHTEDRYLLAQQVRLNDAGIMLAWAQYSPNISFTVNESPPGGRAQTAGAKTDRFLHISFDFPLLDWGHRYRQAATSRAKKRQSQLDEIRYRQQYAQQWETLEQQCRVADARAEQREHAGESAARRREALAVAYEHGMADMAGLAQAQQQDIESRLASIEAERARATARLDWMHHAAVLQERFLPAASRQGGK